MSISPLLDLLINVRTPQDPIMSCLDTQDTMRLRQVSKAGQQAVDSHSKVAYSTRKLFGRYMNDRQTAHFRYLQSWMGALVSGPAAVQFMAREDYSTTAPVNCLDVFCHRPHTRILATFFEFDLGFEQQLDRPAYHGRSADAISAVYTFTRGHLSIKLWIAFNSAFDAVIHSWSTIDMVMISHEQAISLFPWTTFVKRRWHQVNYRRGGLLPCFSWEMDAEARGFQYRPIFSVHEVTSSDSELCVGERFVGDRFCWVVTLPSPLSEDIAAARLTLAEYPKQILAINSFYITYNKMNLMSLQHLVLRQDLGHFPDRLPCIVASPSLVVDVQREMLLVSELADFSAQEAQEYLEKGMEHIYAIRARLAHFLLGA
ncbi:hypothetical protein C8J56DRAFT_1041999 [Mycena floridula]|nr:hypothetical protein C8J56DRAFT_1041999 [Mycena floridula]